MVGANAAGTHVEHPAPAREKADIFTLAFCVLGAPFIWALHFLTNVTIAGRVCSALVIARPPFAARMSVLGIDLLALIIAAIALLISTRVWRATRHEGQDKQAQGEPLEHAVHVGEGRTRFMALGGIILSATFTVAILFDTVAAIMVTSCGK